MKIQLAPVKIIKDMTNIWQEGNADIVMDLKNLTFKEGSLEEIYSFHVLDHLFPQEIIEALNSWKRCLKKGGKLYIIVDDFEYICRALVGGDINVDKFNEQFAHPMNFTRDNLIAYLRKVGFEMEEIVLWFANLPSFDRQHYELIVSATKNHG